MIRILKEIYDDSVLRGILGFKGGTMAMMFYGLPRMSVDLDFDLLDSKVKEKVFERLDKILPKFGKVLEKADKKYTLFYLVDYGYEQRKLKIEINKIKKDTVYEIKNYLGISMLVMNGPAMLACKMAAVVGRKHEANRDVFDMWYFLKSGMEIDEQLFENESGMKMREGWKVMVDRINRLKPNEVLFGLGDLLDESKKYFVREKMIDELKFEIGLRSGESDD